jgi:hypothetical protein
VRREIIYLASHLHTCRAVALAFNRWHGLQITVGKSWVAEVIRDKSDAIRALRKEQKRRLPASIEVGDSNDSLGR